MGRWSIYILRLCAEEEQKLRDENRQTSLNYHTEIDLAEVFRALYTNRGVTDISDELIAETALFFRDASRLRLRLYAGAAALLQDLRNAGKRVVLLSNAQRLFTVPELRFLGIYGMFDNVYISSDCGHKKPDPEFFLCPIRELGLDPSECLMIGNDPDCDARGALDVGMDAYYIHSGLSPQPCPDRIKLRLRPERFQTHMDLRLVGKRLIAARSSNP